MRIAERVSWVACLIGSLEFAASAPAAASTQTQPAGGRSIEEVVVTAQKRESNLQETPIAITAMTTEQIERDQIDDFRDISRHTPSLTFSQTQGFSQMSMRGVGLDLTNLAGETSVALYQDGVYQGATFIHATPAFDLERIEILRGPQGTLYGRNATAGAVNVITRQPSEELDVNAAFTAGNYDQLKSELGVSGPLIPDLLSGRASVLYSDRDGYRDNRITGEDESDEAIKAGRGSLYFTFSDSVDLVLRGDYTRHRSSSAVLENLQVAPTATGISAANIGGFLAIPDPISGVSLADVFGLTFPQADPRSIVSDPDDRDLFTEQPTDQEVEIWGVSGTLTWDTGPVLARLIAAYRDSEWDRLSDNDGTDLTLLTMAGLQTNEQTTVELNLSGSIWEDRVDWIVGAFYFQEDGLAQFFYDLYDYQTTFEALFGVFGPGGAPLPPGSLAAFGTRLKTGVGSAAPFLDFRIDQDSDSQAVFGQATLHVREDTRLTLGARYTEDEKEVHRELTNNLGGAPCDSSDRESWSEATYAAILDHDLNDTTMIYGSLTTGYKAGGFNAGECAGAFDPENLLSYEVGAKTTLADGRLQLNGALFLYDYDDIQVNRFVENASVIANAAEAEILGAELEFVGLIGERLVLNGGIAWLDTEYGGGATFSDPIITGSPPVLVDGNELLRSPEWKMHVGAEYGWLTRVGNLLLRVDTTYSDNYYFDVFEASLPNQSEMEQDAYTISNARFIWTDVDERLEVQVFVENIEDELYSEGRVSVGTTGAVLGEFSAPRTYGLRVSAKLGGVD